MYVKFQRTLRRMLACVLSVLLGVIAVLGYTGETAKAVPYTDGIMFGQYYRLRHSQSKLYLTMNSTSDADNVGCSLQVRNANNKGQIFYLGIFNSTNTYSLSPLSSSSRRVLTLASASNSNNINIVLKANTASKTQQWEITRTTLGYRIDSYANDKVLGTRLNGTSVGTAIATQGYSMLSTDWYFEPAYEGYASYFMTAGDLSKHNSDTVNRIVDLMEASKYECERVNLPVTGNIRIAIPNNRMTVIHGHGSPGKTVLNQSDGTTQYLYSEKATSGNMSFDFMTQKNSYIMFISCKSATASDTRRSMIEAAFDNGVCCVTGYKNNVAAGEDYFEVMMTYIQKFPTMTLYEAMSNADKTYTADQRKVDNCPANVSNRTTYGNPNFSIHM